MGLYLGLSATNGAGSTVSIEGLEIIRQEPLVDPAHPQDEVHEYRASFWKQGRKIMGPAYFQHRYGDGAWTCTKKALEALGQ